MADPYSIEVAELVDRAAAGDKPAWGELVRRYTPLVWGVARAHRLTTDEAADVIQNVWLNLLQHIDGIRSPSSLPAWLATVTRREAMRTVSVRRHTAHDIDMVDELVDTQPTPDELVERDQLNARLRQAFAKLQPRCQTILSLLIVEPPPSYTEVAAALQLPIGSIGPARARCLAHLRRLLAADETTTDAKLLDTLIGSSLATGQPPANVIHRANEALQARPPRQSDAQDQNTGDPGQ